MRRVVLWVDEHVLRHRFYPCCEWIVTRDRGA